MLTKILLYVGIGVLGISTLYLGVENRIYKSTNLSLQSQLDEQKANYTLCSVTNSIRDSRLAALGEKVDAVQRSLDLVITDMPEDNRVTIIEEQNAPDSCEGVIEFLQKNLPSARFE